MTPKQLRDILAYYPAPVSYELLHIGREPNIWHQNDGFMNFNHVLEEFLCCTDRIRNAKVRLRPISSLSDEELWECARMYGYAGITPESPVIRASRSFEVGNFYLSFSGEVDLNGRDLSPINEFASLITYLQSIGVYVPGTIGKEFVELI